MKKDSQCIEIGIYTFGELLPDPQTGKNKNAQQRIKEIVSAAKLADEAGLDVFGVGEHHRLDFASSAPSVLLAAISQVTKQIKLTSATTVLSTIDPVRLFEDFASLDLLSNGRAEIMTGRGAFVESFPLFGYDLTNSQHLFAEHIDLLLKLNEKKIVTWKGQLRSSLHEAEIAPRPLQDKLPIWVAVGQSVESTERTGTLGAGLALAMLGNDPVEYKPIVDLYKIAGQAAGHKPEDLKVAVASHGFLAETSQKAYDEFFPYYLNYFKKYMRSKQALEMSRALFERMASAKQGLFVGSPQQMIEKMLYHHELFGNQRFLFQMDIGGLPFSAVAKSIELLACAVAPIVRKEIKNSKK